MIRIVRDVRRWLAERADEDVIGWLEVLLEARENWLSIADPTWWKSGDAHRLLVDVAASRLTDKDGMAEHGPAALLALIDFLDETDRFHPSSMRTAALRKELDRAVAKFPAAMADESVPGDAPIASPFRRDAVDVRPVPVSPSSLPPGELATRVRESVLLRKLVACGRWAAGGRKVTKHGFPSPADTRSFGEALGITVRESIRDPRDQIPLIRSWRLALDLEVLQLHRTQVVAGPAFADMERLLAGETGSDETLRTWQPVIDVAVSGPAQPDVRDEQARDLEKFCRPWGPRALGELYRIEGEIDLDDLVEKLIDLYHEPSISQTLAALTGAAVRTAVLAGFEAGAVAVTAQPDVDAARRLATLLDEPTWAITPTPGTRVMLTPLGRHLARPSA